MSPTVEELYKIYVIPEKQRQRERDYRKLLRQCNPIKKKHEVHPVCRDRGHHVPIQHTITQTESGRTYAKCETCKQPFEMAKISPYYKTADA